MRYGSVNGASFNLPDLRGEFIRGWDHSRGIDSGRVLGSSQTDELGSHNHLAQSGYAYNPYFPFINWGARGVFGGSPDDGMSQYWTGSTGGTETRPRNIALMYIIKL